MTQYKAVVVFSALLMLIFASVSTGLAAPRQQGTNVEEGKCEVVSVGQYFCKIDGKCYYCDTGTNPDKNKNCYKETTCAAAVRPGIKGTMRPPLSKNAPILRRGVEGDEPGTPAQADPGTAK